MPPHPPSLQGLNRTLVHPGQRLCCALSGGADSTVLLLALLEANAAKDSLGLVLSALHIHHGLRGAEADADETFVRDLCQTHNIPLTVEHVDTPARRQTEREGLEEAARHLRYDAFRRHLAANGADALATAHTLDDQAETVLLKLLRGAWTEGLAAISPILHLADQPNNATRQQPTPGAPHLASEMWAEPSHPVQREAPTSANAPRQRTAPTPANPSQPQPTPAAILRPLLHVRRAAIERFLRERNQPWRDDTSNRDLTLTRNRLRHELMPLLRTFNPSLDETLARTAEIARDEQAFWQAEVARVLPNLLLPGKPVRGGGRAVGTGEPSLALEIERLKPHSPALQRRLLRAAAAHLDCRLSAEETAKLLALAGLAAYPGLTPRNGTRLDLSHGLRAERSLRDLRLTRTAPSTIR